MATAGYTVTVQTINNGSILAKKVLDDITPIIADGKTKIQAITQPMSRFLSFISSSDTYSISPLDEETHAISSNICFLGSTNFRPIITNKSSIDLCQKA